MPLPRHISEATEEIDAALFTGDTFVDGANRVEFRRLMARWESELASLDKLADELLPTSGPASQ